MFQFCISRHFKNLRSYKQFQKDIIQENKNVCYHIFMSEVLTVTYLIVADLVYIYTFNMILYCSQKIRILLHIKIKAYIENIIMNEKYTISNFITILFIKCLDT